MPTIEIRLEGDGLKRLRRGTQRLHERTNEAIQRGLISGGRKTTSEMKKALVKQTSVNKRPIDHRVRGYAKPNEWVINARGPGVDITDVKKVSGRIVKTRDLANQPRDSSGRFALWPRRFGKGVTATVWGESRTFWQSFKDEKGFRAQRASRKIQTLFGPNIADEAVKDESARAFNVGARMTLVKIEGRIAKLSKA